MTVERDVSKKPRKKVLQGAVRPTWLRAQPEYISWKGMMSQTEDSKDSIDEQHSTSEDDKDEDSDWENISRREVNNCSSDYYGNYVKERPIEKGEWLVVNEVTAPQSTEEWFKPSSSKPAKGKHSTTTVAAAARRRGTSIKGWVNGMQKCLRSGKPTSSETRISEEAYVEVCTNGESDTDDLPPLPLLQRRPDTPIPQDLIPRPRAGGQRRVDKSQSSRLVDGLRSAARRGGSACTVFYAPMMA